MTKQDLGQALELFTTGISLQEISDYYEVDAIALNAVFKEITEMLEMRTKYDSYRKIEVRQSIINNDDLIDYQ